MKLHEFFLTFSVVLYLSSTLIEEAERCYTAMSYLLSLLHLGVTIFKVKFIVLNSSLSKLNFIRFLPTSQCNIRHKNVITMKLNFIALCNHLIRQFYVRFSPPIGIGLLLFALRQISLRQDRTQLS